ncbi:MAG: YebC/PmpR family DNA-binding transcriptional regulator, partial [Elusimicrobiota bacterium]
TSSEIRKIFASHNGNLGAPGCVAWMFQPKGYLTVDKKAWPDEEKLMSIAIDAGGEDFKAEDDESYEIVTGPAEFEAVKKALEAAKVPLTAADVTMIPNTTVKLSGGDADQMLALMDELENHDDVTEVYANFDIPREILDKAGQG